MKNEATKDNSKKFNFLKGTIDSAMRSLKITRLETELLIVDEVFSASKEDDDTNNEINKFSVKNRVSIEGKGKELSFYLEAYFVVGVDEILKKPQSQWRDFDIINSGTPLFTDNENFDASLFSITVHHTNIAYNLNQAFNSWADKGFLMNTGKTLSGNHMLNGDKDTQEFQLYSFILDIINNEISSKTNSVNFKALKKLEEINKSGIENTLNKFNDLLGVMSI